MITDQNFETVLTRLDILDKRLDLIFQQLGAITRELDAQNKPPLDWVAPEVVEQMLKVKYDEFKKQWDGNGPIDFSTLKDTLIKLKSTLSAVMAHPPDDVPETVEKSEP